LKNYKILIILNKKNTKYLFVGHDEGFQTEVEASNPQEKTSNTLEKTFFSFS
jgi:hypothetical protein